MANEVLIVVPIVAFIIMLYWVVLAVETFEKQHKKEIKRVN